MSVRFKAAVLFLAVFAVSGAGAAELRPFDQNTYCLDGGTEVRPGVNRVQLAACNDTEGQNVRRGREHTVYIGSLCLQALSIQGQQPEITVAAAPCHGRDGQRWALTRDGRLTPGDKLCLTVSGSGSAASLALTPCKTPPDDASDQKWSIYGKFE